MVQLTRAEIEKKLEDKYLGRVISISIPYPPPTRGLRIAQGKIQKLAVETHTGEPIVGFDINGKRYKADINYFIENATIHGNPHRADGGDKSGLPKGD